MMDELVPLEEVDARLLGTPRSRRAHNLQANGNAGGEETRESRPPEFSDEALALRFAERHQHELRYVALWNKWLTFDGARWCFDETVFAFDLARQICREAAARCNEREAVRRSIASAKTVGAVVQLARADRRLAATVEQWDTDLWLLNTPAGNIDLRSGGMRSHRPADYMTKMTAVAPGGDCPQWLAFLDRVTGSDQELQAFLQRFTGYALTGSTREHALAFCYGHGANGKSVFMNTVSAVFGDYHQTAAIQTFTATRHDQHPTVLAALRGARLVTATETEDRQRWADSRIKQLTGGDKVRAYFMRQDEFEFTPQLKLIISGNHRPSLRAIDESIRRRFNLIPFNVTIPPEERDLQLADRLRDEWPGILAWMIEGRLEWQRLGLAAPPAVIDATAAYLEAEDALAAWMEDQCERDANAWTRSTDLFAATRHVPNDLVREPATSKSFERSWKSTTSNTSANRARGGLAIWGCACVSGNHHRSLIGAGCEGM